MIYFPSLNLKFHIPKVAFTIFNIEIYWYAIIIVLAIIIAFFLLKYNEHRCNIGFETIVDLAIFLMPISFIGARAYYIIFNLEPFLKNPIQILNLRTGGLAIYGGVIAGAITCYIFCKKIKIYFLDMLDYIAPSLAIGQAIGRWGNFVNVEAYGTNTTNLLRMGIIENSKYIEVHPTFLYESMATFIIFIILMKYIKNRKFKGEIVYIYFILYSFARFWIEALRIDSLMFYNFRISQILSLILFVVFTLFMSFNVIKMNKALKIAKKAHAK